MLPGRLRVVYAEGRAPAQRLGDVSTAGLGLCSVQRAAADSSQHTEHDTADAYPGCPPIFLLARAVRGGCPRGKWVLAGERGCGGGLRGGAYWGGAGWGGFL